MRHVTFGRDSDCRLEAGAAFNKVWRVRNDSDAPWPDAVCLVHVGGDDFGCGDATTAVPGGVAPGAEADISVALTAPGEPGYYDGYFRLMVTDDGRRLGPRLGVAIVVSSPSSGEERGGGGHGGDPRRAELNAAAIQAVLDGAPDGHVAVVAPLIASGILFDAMLVRLALRRVAKFRGDVSDPATREQLVAQLTLAAAKAQAKAAKRGAKAAGAAVKRQARQAAKQARREAKLARKALKAQGKCRRKEDKRRRRRRCKSSSSGSSSSSGYSSDTSGSSDSDE